MAQGRTRSAFVAVLEQHRLDPSVTGEDFDEFGPAITAVAHNTGQ